MKRWILPILCALLVIPIVAMATGSLSVPINFGSYTAGVHNLSDFDTNFSAVSTYINAREITQATCATRPTAGTAGRFYFCSDTMVLYADTGSAWTQIAPAVSGAVAEQYTGLTLSNDATTPGTKVDIAAGAASSDDATITSRVLMILASAYTKTTAAWAVGTGNGCLDTATVAASTWYHVFLIERLDTSVTDILCSTSATSPTMPSNYTKKRRIGSVLTDGNTAINFFNQFPGGIFVWATPSALNVSDVDPGTAAHTATATTPNGVVTRASLNVCQAAATVATGVYISALASADTAPSITATPLVSVGVDTTATANQPGCAQTNVWTDTSRQFRFRNVAGGAGQTTKIVTIGWQDQLRP